MRLLVYPRDSNPYQELLYKNLEQLEVHHRYIGELSGRHTLNLILLPFELAVNRIRGFKCLHLHWVYRFAIPVVGRRQFIRRLMRWYFVCLLEWCRVIGVAVVWTAHNVVPHDQVFDDDELGRRQLTARCAAVIAHNEETLRELVAMRCALPPTAVIAPGPPALLICREGARRVEPQAGLRILFAGRVSAYKGVEDLLEVLATQDIPPGTSCVVAGMYDDPALAQRLVQAAARCRIPVELRLSYVSDETLAMLLVSADAVVLPFRRTTSSSSVLMALGAGCPVIIPDIAGHARRCPTRLRVALRRHSRRPCGGNTGGRVGRPPAAGRKCQPWRLATPTPGLGSSCPGDEGGAAEDGDGNLHKCPESKG